MVVRKKSPRAPSFPLEEALDKALAMYQKELLHPVPTDVAAKDFGYKNGKNGAALRTIATLKAYGLIDSPKHGYLAVNRSVQEYKLNPDASQRREVVRSWVATPKVFQQLFDRFPNSLPSDAALKYELVRMGFIESSAEDVLKSFKQSIDFAGFYSDRTDEEEFDAATSSDPADGTAVESDSRLEASAARQLTAEPTVSGIDRIPVRLKGGRKAWIEIPTPFYEEDKETLRKHIDIVMTNDYDDEE